MLIILVIEYYTKFNKICIYVDKTINELIDHAIIPELIDHAIIPDRVLRTRKQGGVRQILKVCKERAPVSAVNTPSQNSVRNYS